MFSKFVIALVLVCLSHNVWAFEITQCDGVDNVSSAIAEIMYISKMEELPPLGDAEYTPDYISQLAFDLQKNNLLFSETFKPEAKVGVTFTTYEFDSNGDNRVDKIVELYQDPSDRYVRQRVDYDRDLDGVFEISIYYENDECIYKDRSFESWEVR